MYEFSGMIDSQNEISVRHWDICFLIKIQYLVKSIIHPPIHQK